jgi:hypothetical protein
MQIKSGAFDSDPDLLLVNMGSQTADKKNAKICLYKIVSNKHSTLFDFYLPK